ncbi:HAD-IIB family hydrolase [Thalassolituus sp.]|uniref:HAD-IIB family hydrolase n=1 Tax=Thalassolituus sp. TaxID=2030822 RepID=UPI0035156E4D
MTTEKQILVFTDLDGTLLDHTSYSYAPAEKALQTLKKHHIPLVLNTSKTRAEVKLLRRRMENTFPFICENGSAVYLPDSDGDFVAHVSGSGYDGILSVLSQLRKDGFRFRGFNDMPASEVSAVTGLNTDDATLAKQREATEPLLWQGNEEELLQFTTAIEHHGLRLVQGGRFYHVMNQTDKADGMKKVADYYRQSTGRDVITIALGDGGNDVGMLEAADFPIVIPGKKTTLTIKNPAAVTAPSEGPKGWQQVMGPLLDKLLAQ